MPDAVSPATSLFDDEPVLDRLALPDADISFMRCFFCMEQADRHFNGLMEEVPWRHDAILVWGKEHMQPRLTAWYGDPGTDYTYSGLSMHPLPWSPRLASIKSAVENASGQRFNSVLLNLYRDERDSVGWHSDDEAELGKAPCIASLSLGETRTFKLRHKRRKEEKPVGFALQHGSLLLMKGATQENWLHAVDKERQARGPRINLTFRMIFPTAGRRR